ncbi:MULTISPECIES: SRPBCC family protein [unclassified Thioalkalivibrio]|uniref:SRPBCC family protein n=1 Tax=unclassified Thioalkalivibrio TaxID=2621013 RepID=UPI00037A6028|nr:MULTISPECIES: SRPBCC family protein [unclassified Thioalkalivibrio]
MPTIEHQAHIRADRPDVFALITRVEEFVHYSEAIETIARVGEARYRWVVRIAGIPLNFDVEITESEAPERFSWQSLTGVQNHGTYHLTPAQGGTNIHLLLEYELDNPLLEKTIRQAAKPLIETLSREIIGNVEAELHKTSGEDADREGPRKGRQARFPDGPNK